MNGATEGGSKHEVSTLRFVLAFVSFTLWCAAFGWHIPGKDIYQLFMIFAALSLTPRAERNRPISRDQAIRMIWFVPGLIVGCIFLDRLIPDFSSNRYLDWMLALGNYRYFDPILAIILWTFFSALLIGRWHQARANGDKSPV